MNINKNITVDFLYLDTSICTRCQNTESNLNDSLDNIKELLNNLGFEVTLNRVHIETESQAIQQHFISSPTIRVNGADIQMDVKESHCSSCSSLANNTAIDCRVWTYNGEQFSAPPQGLIIDSILSTIYQTEKIELAKKKGYLLPDNLKQYFENQDQLCANVGAKEKTTCCDVSDCC